MRDFNGESLLSASKTMLYRYSQRRGLTVINLLLFLFFSYPLHC